MSSNTKKVLIILGIVLVCCIVAGVAAFFAVNTLTRKVAESVEMDPAQAAAAARQIADYDLPAGYGEIMTMDMFGYKYVIIGPAGGSTGGMQIMLMQVGSSSGLSQEEIAEQMRRALEQRSGQPGMQMKVVETKTMTIRGQETQVVISEAASQGFTIRQLFTTFPGKSGQAMLMIQGAGEEWDQEMVDQFLASIR